MYMMEQVEQLLVFFEKKLGFRKMTGKDMFKFYKQYHPVQGISIPFSSFKEYVTVYNKFIEERQKKGHEVMEKERK